MLRLTSVILFLFFVVQLSAQHQNSWNLFTSAKFKEVPVNEYYAADLLVKTPEIAKLDQKEMTISGYYIPTGDDNIIIISKLPMAACFFCGGGGLESIMEIKPKQKIKRQFSVDEIITFKGILTVNDKDYNELPFIMKSAVLVE